MKRTSFRRAALLACVALTAGMTLASCEKENNGGTIRLNAEKLSGDGKTYVEGVNMGWENGDVIRFNGTECTVTDGVATGIPEDVPLIAFYPSNISNETNAAATSFNVTVPSEYTYTYRDGHQILALPMVGKASLRDKSITMKHLCSTMQITVTNNLSEELVLDSITLGGSGLSGTSTVTFSDSDSDPVPGAGNVDYVRISFSNCTIAVRGNLTVQIPVLPVAEGTATGVSVRGHLATSNMWHYRFGRSTSIALRRAMVHAAPVTMTTPVEGNHMKEIYVATTFPEDAIEGVFSVSGSQHVCFSKGNLRATGTTSSSPSGGWTWSFAEHQYDYIGNAKANTMITNNGTISQNGTVDLFCWSTTGTYYGITHRTLYAIFEGEFVDWGGALQDAGWRTLSITEWDYLIKSRDGARFAKATIGNVNKSGLIIFPDNYVTVSENSATFAGVSLSDVNKEYGAAFNNISFADWTTLEAAGCVFLPAAGYREGTSVESVGNYGGYWSSSDNAEDTPYYYGNDMYFNSTYWVSADQSFRYRGMSVRLVKDL